VRTLWRVGIIVAVALLFLALSDGRTRADEPVLTVPITASSMGAAGAVTDFRCHIFPVQPGHGARAPGRPGYGGPPPRPDCDNAANVAPADRAPAAATDLTYHGGPLITSAQSYFLYLNCTPASTCWGDPSGFLTDLFASNFIHVTDQYVGTTANARYTVGSSVNLTGAEPHTIDQQFGFGCG